MKRSEILRILDANLNRSREGLRVCEEITRFVLRERRLTDSLRQMRHRISGCLKRLPVSAAELVRSRNVRSDVGKGAPALGVRRGDAPGFFLANAERAKESLRVLEETSKFLDAELAERFKKIRFHIYAIEKKALPKLEALRHRRP